MSDRRVLLLSIVLQLALALLFGHSFDTRIFMATGYLVGTGQNPYVGQDLGAVFHHVRFDKMSSIGYPPPWPLVLGLLYLCSYAVIPNLLIYNLVIKLPVIAANIGLAYLVAAMVKDLGASPAVARKAWVLLLFNPLLLYFGAAWGQIDAIAALLALSAVALLYAKRTASSAVLLALSICVKPIALPVLPVALVYLWSTSSRQAARRVAGYAGVFLAGVVLFAVVPFALPGWDPAPILHHWNFHFTQTGALSLTTVLRLWRDPVTLPGSWWLVGLAWIPALGVAALALRRGDGGLEDLLKKTTALVFVFFLTRAWLATPNVVLLVPLVLILAFLGALPRRALLAVWVLPLAFTVVSHSPFELLFPAFPRAMDTAIAWADRFEDVTIVARVVLVVAWQVVGWWIVVQCLRHAPAAADEREHGGALEAVAP
jgi:hypothetical protein